MVRTCSKPERGRYGFRTVTGHLYALKNNSVCQGRPTCLLSHGCSATRQTRNWKEEKGEVIMDDTNTTVGTPPAEKKIFLDVHELGPGNVNAEAAAHAHQRDLETQG